MRPCSTETPVPLIPRGSRSEALARDAIGPLQENPHRVVIESGSWGAAEAGRWSLSSGQHVSRSRLKLVA